MQNFVKFQKVQLENLVDFEKCCKPHIFLQKSQPIQPKTSNICRNFANRRSLTSLPALALSRRDAVYSAARTIVHEDYGVRSSTRAASCRIARDRAYLTGLVLGCIEAKISKYYLVNMRLKALSKPCQKKGKRRKKGKLSPRST